MFQNNKNLIAIVHILVLWFFAVNMMYAQEGNNAGFNLEEHQNKSSYREVVRLLYKAEYSKAYPEYGVSNINGKKEIWEISSFDNGALYKEVYYSKNETLIYAIDSDRYIKENSLQENIWECEFFTKDGKIYSEESFGHGKTERDDWDPNIIFKMFEKRKEELKILQNNQ